MVLDLMGGSLVVLSPHLDDGVMSLGAAIATWVRRGNAVRLVTVLAGDPYSEAPAGPWDARSGFRTAGEAARARRDEDQRACSELGAEPVWLPYGDLQYGRGEDDDAIWDDVMREMGDARRVVAPGFPLSHRDHAWLFGLALARRPEWCQLGLYVEQPYALRRDPPGEDAVTRLPQAVDPAPGFGPSSATASARRAKRRACRAYRSQLDQLAAANRDTWRGVERRIRQQERRRGGEWIAWLGEGQR